MVWSSFFLFINTKNLLVCGRSCEPFMIQSFFSCDSISIFLWFELADEVITIFWHVNFCVFCQKHHGMTNGKNVKFSCVPTLAYPPFLCVQWSLNALNLLRCHVIWCSTLQFWRICHSKVNYYNFPRFCHHNVTWLQISVHKARLMNALHTLEYLTHNDLQLCLIYFLFESKWI